MRCLSALAVVCLACGGPLSEEVQVDAVLVASSYRRTVGEPQALPETWYHLTLPRCSLTLSAESIGYRFEVSRITNDRADGCRHLLGTPARLDLLTVPGRFHVIGIHFLEPEPAL